MNKFGVFQVSSQLVIGLIPAYTYTRCNFSLHDAFSRYKKLINFSFLILFGNAVFSGILAIIWNNYELISTEIPMTTIKAVGLFVEAIVTVLTFFIGTKLEKGIDEKEEDQHDTTNDECSETRRIIKKCGFWLIICEMIHMVSIIAYVIPQCLETIFNSIHSL